MKRILIALLSLSIIPATQAMNWSGMAVQAAKGVAYTGGVIAFVKSLVDMNTGNTIGALVMNQAGNPMAQQFLLPIAQPAVQDVVQNQVVAQITQNKGFFDAHPWIAKATTGIAGACVWQLATNKTAHAYMYAGYQAAVNSWLMLKVNTLLGNCKDMLRQLATLNNRTNEVKDKVENLEKQLETAKAELAQNNNENTAQLKGQIEALEMQLKALRTKFEDEMKKIQEGNARIEEKLDAMSVEQKSFISKFSDSFWNYFKTK